VHTASLDPFRGNAAVLATHLPHAERVLGLFHVARLGRTLHAWRREMCAHSDRPAVSNGPTENLNLEIKDNKRIAHTFQLHPLPTATIAQPLRRTPNGYTPSTHRLHAA
jgi:hypothetical protein